MVGPIRRRAGWRWLPEVGWQRQRRSEVWPIQMPVTSDCVDWAVWLGEAEGDPYARFPASPAVVLPTSPMRRTVNSVRNSKPEFTAFPTPWIGTCASQSAE
jgi:hypothetical protein